MKLPGRGEGDSRGVNGMLFYAFSRPLSVERPQLSLYLDDCTPWKLRLVLRGLGSGWWGWPRSQSPSSARFTHQLPAYRFTLQPQFVASKTGGKGSSLSLSVP